MFAALDNGDHVHVRERERERERESAQCDRAVTASGQHPVDGDERGRKGAVGRMNGSFIHVAVATPYDMITRRSHLFVQRYGSRAETRRDETRRDFFISPKPKSRDRALSPPMPSVPIGENHLSRSITLARESIDLRNRERNYRRV
jgi:hypothetical protein